MNTIHPQRFDRQAALRSRRGGIALVYLALTLVAMLGVTSMVVDMGNLYTRRSDAQRAADAAALAGGYYMQQNPPVNGDTATRDAAAITFAQAVAQQNGYDPSTVFVYPEKNGTMATMGDITVKISRAEPLFFGGIFGSSSRLVEAKAVAQVSTQVDIPIDPQYYGINTGPTNYELFGPDAQHQFGDPYSTKFLSDQTTPNPQYTGAGYNFTLNVPPGGLANGSSMVEVEIYDPDCHNAGDVPDASSTAVDELRTPAGDSGTPANATVTQYSLYWDNGTPNDPSDDVLIAQKSYGDDPTTDMQWTTPDGFTFDRSQYPTGNFRINVTSIAGSSENGFNLRAGSVHDKDVNGNSVINETDWQTQYGGAAVNGTSIAAQGHLPANFNVNGQANILLGNVPSSAAGGQFMVTKFDTDVGAVSVYYICDSLPGQTFPGTLAGNDQWQTDTISLPANYPGGNWHAIYTAGSQDTSDWTLTYTNGSGRPGNLKLIE